MPFVELDIAVDENELVDRATDNLAVRFAGWVPNEGHLEVGQIEELARIVWEVIVVMSTMGEEAFREFGRKLHNIAPVDGAPATFLATVTARDNLGYTLPVGTIVGYQKTGDELWGFRSTQERVIAAGTNQAVNVPFEATELGSLYNGVPNGAAIVVIDNLAWIDSIVTSLASSGGADRETDDAYLDRLAEELRLMSPRPILPNDFAVLARRTAGVHRAVAIDGYNPGPPETFNNERMVAVAALDSNGAAIAVAVKNTVQTALDAMREVTFQVNMIDPTANEIDIVFTAKAQAGFDPAAVETAAEQAVKDFIDPKKWAGGEESPPAWRRITVLRYLEVAAVIENVPGIDFITTTGGLFDLTINGARADLTLVGQAPIPAVLGAGAGQSSVDGTVS